MRFSFGHCTHCAGALKKISADSGGELECKITAAKDILQQFSELQKEQTAIARSSDGDWEMAGALAAFLMDFI